MAKDRAMRKCHYPRHVRMNGPPSSELICVVVFVPSSILISSGYLDKIINMIIKSAEDVNKPILTEGKVVPKGMNTPLTIAAIYRLMLMMDGKYIHVIHAIISSVHSSMCCDRI